MITYTEKGVGLHLAIAKAGHSLIQRDGVWIASDDAAVQAIIDSYALADVKLYAIGEVLKHAKMLRDKVVASISPGEMASWSIKASEAAKFRATGDESQCPMLTMEAQSRQVSLEVLVGKVEGNSQRLSTIEATIGGADGRHRDAIAACATIGDVLAYDYRTGWPEV